MLGHIIFHALIEVWKGWEVRRALKRWIAAREFTETADPPGQYDGYQTRVVVGQHLNHTYDFHVTMSHGAYWQGVFLAASEAPWKPKAGLEPAPTGDPDFDGAVQVWLEPGVTRPEWLLNPDVQHALGTLSDHAAFVVESQFAFLWMKWNIEHPDFVEEAMKSVLNTSSRLCNTLNAAIKGEPIPSFLEHKKPQPKQIKLPAKRKSR